MKKEVDHKVEMKKEVDHKVEMYFQKVEDQNVEEYRLRVPYVEE
jgi:hypothetical protein